MRSCKGCRVLSLEGPLKQGDCWTLHCNDPDKPVLGTRRTVAVSWVGPPRPPERPAWCRGKKKAARRDGAPTDGTDKGDHNVR